MYLSTRDATDDNSCDINKFHIKSPPHYSESFTLDFKCSILELYWYNHCLIELLSEDKSALKVVLFFWELQLNCYLSPLYIKLIYIIINNAEKNLPYFHALVLFENKVMMYGRL